MTLLAGEPHTELLCDGWVIRDGAAVVDASSSSVLVEIGGERIVVDTGSRRCEQHLLDSLSRLNIAPSEITRAVNTHMHMDHCGCNHLFEEAKFYCHTLEEPPSWTVKVREDIELLPGLRLVHTPGHTRGSMSVFVYGDVRIAICGDAIPTRSNYESHVPPAIHFDRAVALKSMELILAWADLVVPGHDKPFEVMRKR